MKTKETLRLEEIFGILKGDVEEARKNLKKWREEFSKDAEKRHKFLFGNKHNK